MNVEVVKAEKEHKTVLRQLLELYCYDTSEYIPVDVNEHGMYEYQYQDVYWQEPERHPYFIKVDGKYAGFVLVNKVFRIIDDPAGHAIAEFFVMRKYRLQGVGALVAKVVFELHPGPWEASQILKNTGAIAFWEKVIDQYTKGQFSKHYLETNGLKNQVLIFKNGLDV
ncbi:MAG: GNAT family N-acetyltransferase [Bacteroidota bacterium]